MIRWAAVTDHRRSYLSSVFLRGTEGRRRHVSPGVCPGLLPWPASHTPHDPRIIPALRASTDGTRGRPPRDGGVCARTLRQRPAGRRLRTPGIAMTVRPTINGAYLVGHHVLLHPIHRQEPHPLSHLQGILCQSSVTVGTGAVIPEPRTSDGYDGAMTSQLCTNDGYDRYDGWIESSPRERCLPCKGLLVLQL